MLIIEVKKVYFSEPSSDERYSDEYFRDKKEKIEIKEFVDDSIEIRIDSKLKKLAILV